MKFLIAVISVLATGVSVESRGRIFGGQTANPENFKYQCQIIVPISQTTGSVCGCSVISNTWIITAGHCFEGGYVSKTLVVLGLNADHRYTQTVAAKEVFRHENYFFNNTVAYNDIALVCIPYVEFTPYIQKIPLSNLKNIVNLPITVPAWGQTGGTGKTHPTKLQFTKFRVLDDSICKSKLGKAYLPSNFCTWDNSTSICQGDSGSPVTTIYNSIEQQVGVVSFGLEGQCGAGTPASYTRIYSFLPWIHSTIWNYENTPIGDVNPYT